MELWRKVKFLGEGAHGTVHLAHSSYDQPIAVKSADCDDFPDIEALEREGEILRHLAGAPNMVQCFGEDDSLEDNTQSYNLLLEYAPLGSLKDLLRRVGPMPELSVACYACMLLRGLAGIHSRGIAHCDIRSDNILVFIEECRGIGDLKIVDFGLATWDSERYNCSHFPTSSPESAADWSSGHHCPCNDVWSMGCVIFEMMIGKNIWNWNRPLDLNDLISFPPTLSPNAFDFFKCCLNRDVVPSAERLLEHPFIVDNLRRIDQTITHNVPIQPWISATNMFSESTMESAIGIYYQPQYVYVGCRFVELGPCKTEKIHERQTSLMWNPLTCTSKTIVGAQPGG